MSIPTRVSQCLVPVVHACNPSYSEGRDQEDRGLKPALANSSARPYLKSTPRPLHTFYLGGVVQGVGPDFKPQYCKKKKKSVIASRSFQQTEYTIDYFLHHFT
jgi:hypothetical protein